MAECCDHDHPKHPASANATGEDAQGDIHAQEQNGTPCCAPSTIAVGAREQPQPVAGGEQTEIRIMQMDCPTEEALIRKKLSQLPGVKNMDFNLIQRVLTVVHEPGALDSVLDALRALGFQPEAALASDPTVTTEAPTKSWWPLAFAAFAAVAAETGNWAGAHGGMVAALAIVAVICSGLGTYKKGWVASYECDVPIGGLRQSSNSRRLC